jgi:uncharacterized protein YjbI with pentapeptide repeats
LRDAILHRTILIRADLSTANLGGAQLRGTIMPNGEMHG